jgi:hypothetical protein
MKKSINRSAKTGKFVTEAKAKRSPNTTVKETVKDNSTIKLQMEVCFRAINKEVAILRALYNRL